MGNQITSPSKIRKLDYDELTEKPQNMEEESELKNNGNIVLGYELPDEILLSIFQYLPDSFLVQVIPLVCKHWYSIGQSYHLWKIRLKALKIEISKLRQKNISENWDEPGVLEAVKWLCVNERKKALNHNLLKNPSGAQKFKHWEVHHGGNGLGVEEPPVGCDRIPPEANLPTQHCFASSYSRSKRVQKVSLCRDFNLRASVLDVLQPSLHISEWVSARFDCGGETTTQVDAIGTAKCPAIFVIQWRDSDYGRVQWCQMKKVVQYEDLGPGIHSLLFKNVSKDTQFWAGRYGAKTAGSSLVLNIAQDTE